MGLAQLALFGVLVSVAYGHHNVFVQNNNQARINEIQKQIFTPEYNVNVRPATDKTNLITSVTVQLKNVKVFEVDETKGRFSFGATYRQRWVDPRLVYTQEGVSYIPLRDCKVSIWQPDLYFVNGCNREAYKSADSKSTSFLGVSPNGTVYKSNRILQTVFCPELYNKAVKEITCTVRIESYGYYVDELQTSFDSNGAVLNDERDTLSLEKYNYEGTSVVQCPTLRDSEQGHVAPCLALAFKFTRK